MVTATGQSPKKCGTCGQNRPSTGNTNVQMPTVNAALPTDACPEMQFNLQRKAFLENHSAQMIQLGMSQEYTQKLHADLFDALPKPATPDPLRDHITVPRHKLDLQQPLLTQQRKHEANIKAKGEKRAKLLQHRDQALSLLKEPYESYKAVFERGYSAYVANVDAELMQASDS